MHKTARQVRFSIDPFLPMDSEGFNSFASKPAGQGLSIFLELFVELTGKVEPATGFVVNVVDIDKKVRQFVVPIFAKQIRKYFRCGEHIGFFEIVELLRMAWGQLADKFGAASISKLSLNLNPYRCVAIDSEDCKMIYFSEKFEFSASHKLWNEQFSDERNFEVFGRCANPSGHGHNYTVEVTTKKPILRQAQDGEQRRTIGGSDFSTVDFEKIVFNELIKLLDHKNLNTDVEGFNEVNPTVENIAVFAWNKLAGKFGEAQLHCITVWETDKTYSSYYGQ